MVFGCFELALGLLALAAGAQAAAVRQVVKPFMIKQGTSYIIGNDVWNLTIDARGFGKKLMYRGADLVGRASGHYVSYSTSPFVRVSRADGDRRCHVESELELQAAEAFGTDGWIHGYCVLGK